MRTAKELRKIVEKEPHPEIWIHSFLNQKSLYVTKLLLRFPITPNHLTVGGIILGFVGVILVTFPVLWIHWLGYFLILFYYLTDYCDGQVARYKKMTSKKGEYLDHIGHVAVYPLMFLSIGIYLFNKSGDLINLLLGVTTALLILASFVMNKVYIIVKGVKKSLLEKGREENKMNLKWKLMRIHKTINFQFYVIGYVFLAEIIQPIFSLYGIHLNLLFYVMIFVLVLSFFTFFIQVYIHAKSLDTDRGTS